MAFGTPFWSPFLAVITGALGYAIFWHALLTFSRNRFWISLVWFFSVQLIQLNWLARVDYLGIGIVGVYAMVAFAIALQFAFLSMWIRLPMSVGQAAALSGLWVFFEWMRLFPLGGFPWNPVALVLNHPFSIVCASLFGVFGLSFWVMFTNLLALKGNWKTWLGLALIPYALGFCLIQSQQESQTPDAPTVALVQPSLLPSQKYLTPFREKEYIPAFIQWDRIVELLKGAGRTSFDWILMPEATVPHGAKHPFYPKDAVEQLWMHHFGPQALLQFPNGGINRYVDNAFWVKAIANHFNAQVIIGLDDSDLEGDYNAAFRVAPKQDRYERYEKQILIPVAEIIPFPFWTRFNQFLAKQFGIEKSFTPGKRPGFFSGEMGVVICLEEAYGELVRTVRRMGANCLVSLSNDGWYPRSALPWVHLEHGRLRAAENGVPVLRSCNTGVTAIIDCFGRVVQQILPSESKAGILIGAVPKKHLPTLFTLWGDWAILFLSALFFSRELWKRLLEYWALDYLFR